MHPYRIAAIVLVAWPTALFAENFSADEHARWFHVGRQGYLGNDIETSGVGQDGTQDSFLTSGAFSFDPVPAYHNRDDMSVSGGNLVTPMAVVSSEIPGNSAQYNRTFAVRVRDDYSDNASHYSGDILGNLTGKTLHYRFAIDTNLTNGTPFTPNMLWGDVNDPTQGPDDGANGGTAGDSIGDHPSWVISGHPTDPRIEMTIFGNDGNNAFISELHGVNILTMTDGTFVNVDIPLVSSQFGNYFGGAVVQSEFDATMADVEQIRFQFRSLYGTEGFAFDSNTGITSANFMLDYVQTAELPEPATATTLCAAAAFLLRRRSIKQSHAV